MTTPMLSYKGHRFPVEIINHCVWLYFRFPLSFREVDEHVGVEYAVFSESVALTDHAIMRRGDARWLVN